MKYLQGLGDLAGSLGDLAGKSWRPCRKVLETLQESLGDLAGKSL